MLTLLRIHWHLWRGDKVHKSLMSEHFLGLTMHYYGYMAFSYIFWDVFVKAEYYFKTDKKKPVIVDCGANGGAAVLFFKVFYPEAEIHSFEPDATAFQLLKRNVEFNHFQQVSLYEVALSEREGNIDFYVDEDNPASAKMSIFQERMPTKSVSVRTTRLSAFLEGRSVDLLKIDVEGAEVQIVKDLQENGGISASPLIIMEYHHNLGKQRPNLGGFLQIFENNGYHYQIEAESHDSLGSTQDVMISFYKPASV
jgi:FkbM family methyltransferase